jgi:hypothetical protein
MKGFIRVQGIRWKKAAAAGTRFVSYRLAVFELALADTTATCELSLLLTCAPFPSTFLIS